MFNTLNTVRHNPYPQANGNYRAKNGETDKDGQNPNQQGQQGQQGQRQGQTIARGRAQDVQVQEPVQNRSAIYSPASNAYPQAFPQTQTYAVHTPPAIRHTSGNQINPMQYQAAQSGYQPVDATADMASPINAKNNKINIAQILKDFRNTIKAIATPPEIEEDVNHYLEIVNRQVSSPQPQVNIIQSNLKIAASILDKYISDTLNKDSKVVQNWLDALFLQKINYNYNENDVNPNFLVKFPEQNNKPAQTQNTPDKTQNITQTPIAPVENLPEQNTSLYTENNVHSENYEQNLQNDNLVEFEPEPLALEEEYTQARKVISNKPNITIVPKDTKLKSLFVEAKKYAFSNNPKKAMSVFREAFSRAEELNDTETQSRICLEIGKIYDDNDHYAQALSSYNKSLEYTTDVNVKSRAHYSMAQIYDDVNEVGPALNHYLTSISYAGKSDDLIGQSDSLTRMANIFTDKYDENAFEYYDIAKKLIDQTTDASMKGYVLSNTADACVQFRRNDKALKYYAEAVKNYELTNSNEEIAKNYKSAAEVMLGFNSPNKAKSLLKKALINSVKTSNEDLTAEINAMLASIE